MIFSTDHSPRQRAFSLFQVLIVVAILVILAGITSEVNHDRFYLTFDKKDQAKLQAKAIESAARAYYWQYKQMPANATDLINPGNGEKPFLEGGKDAVTTPWGGQFAIGEDLRGQPPDKVIMVYWMDGVGRAHCQWEKPKLDQEGFTLLDALIIAAILVLLALVSRAFRAGGPPLQEREGAQG